MALVLAQHNIPLASMDHSFGTSFMIQGLRRGSQLQEPKPVAL